MSKVPHLLKGSALPDGEQRRLAEYAFVHPKSALHRKGKHHDAAVLLVHGIGYQNHGGGGASICPTRARRSRILASRWRTVCRLCWR